MELLLDSANEPTPAVLVWLRRFHAARRAVRIAEPPPATRAALRARFAAYAAGRRQPGMLERAVAALSFDSLTQALAAPGTRTAASTSQQHRQLVFSCAAADIALNVHRRPHDKQLDLNGQIFPHGAVAASGWGVLLIGVGGPDATRTDDYGEFSFEEVRPGDYTLTLEAHQIAITMPMVTLIP